MIHDLLHILGVSRRSASEQAKMRLDTIKQRFGEELVHNFLTPQMHQELHASRDMSYGVYRRIMLLSTTASYLEARGLTREQVVMALSYPVPGRICHRCVPTYVLIREESAEFVEYAVGWILQQFRF